MRPCTIDNPRRGGGVRGCFHLIIVSKHNDISHISMMMVASLFMVNTSPPSFPWFQSFITEKAVPAFAHRDNVTNETLKATRARLIRRWWSGYRTAFPPCVQHQGFVAWRKEDRSTNVYIYIYLGNNFFYIYILPPLISRGAIIDFRFRQLRNGKMKNLSPRENEKSVVSVNEGKNDF